MSDTVHRNFSIHRKTYTHKLYLIHIEKSDNEIACKYVSHSKQLLFHSKKKKLHFLTSEWINIQVDYLAGLSFDWIIISLD